MDLNQLRTLIHVAELGSLSKAADRLRIAQPALSRQMRLLEEELGTRLFERHGRGMVISEAGKHVLSRATRIMAEVQDIKADLAELNSTITGRVVIGMPPTVSEIITVPLVDIFRHVHPGVELRFVSAFTGYLLDWLQRGEVDVAVLYDPQPTRSLRSRPLLLESLLLIGDSSAGLSINRAKPFSCLGEHRLLLPSRQHGLRAIVERLAVEADITLNVSVEADSLSTLKNLVRNGHGFTILPLAPIHEDIEKGRLTAAPLIEPSPSRRLVLTSSSDRQITRGAQFAADAIVRVITDLVDRGIWVGHLLET